MRGRHRRKSRGQSSISRNLYTHCARDILPQPTPSHPSRGTWQRPREEPLQEPVCNVLDQLHWDPGAATSSPEQEQRFHIFGPR